MKVNQLYFSPTGGTEKVVRLISDAWDAEKCPIDISVSNADYSAYSFPKEELCIVGVPSFGGRVPAIALSHLQQMKADRTPTILICAYGNRDYDDTLLELKDVVSAGGFHVIAAIAAVTEHSIMHQFGTGRPDAQDQATLQDYAYQIRKALLEHRTLPEIQVKGNSPYLTYHGVPLKPGANNACTRCGICAALCPMAAIPAADPAKTNHETCITCMRCVAVCPNHARKLNPVMAFAAGKKMEKSCSERKENEFFFGCL